MLKKKKKGWYTLITSLKFRYTEAETCHVNTINCFFFLYLLVALIYCMLCKKLENVFKLTSDSNVNFLHTHLQNKDLQQTNGGKIGKGE